MRHDASAMIALDPALETRLREEAALAGTSIEHLVDVFLREALAHRDSKPDAEPEPGYEEFLRRKVERSREAGLRGELVPHDDVMAEIDRLIDTLASREKT